MGSCHSQTLISLSRPQCPVNGFSLTSGFNISNEHYFCLRNVCIHEMLAPYHRTGKFNILYTFLLHVSILRRFIRNSPNHQFPVGLINGRALHRFHNIYDESRSGLKFSTFHCAFILVLLTSAFFFLSQKIRSGTSHSGRKASFQEDLKQARCEFAAAHVRYAKLVTLTADDKFNTSVDNNNKDSNKPAKADEF